MLPSPLPFHWCYASWASICFLHSLPASCLLQPFHLIFHFVLLVIVLEVKLIIWLSNPDPFKTAPLCKFSITCLSSIIASSQLGLDCGFPVPTKLSYNFLFMCVLYLFALKTVPLPLPPPFPITTIQNPACLSSPSSNGPHMNFSVPFFVYFPMLSKTSSCTYNSELICPSTRL